MRTPNPLVYGGLGYVLGGAVAAALVVTLNIAVGASSHAGTTVDPRGGDTVFKVAWSAAVFGIGPLVAVLVPVAVGRRLQREAVVVAIVVALALYALTAWATATPLSVGNACRLGVRWPVTSIGGCD
jgi:asparagine N-glycosylation enzyme membrane subunit Stt3